MSRLLPLMALLCALAPLSVRAGSLQLEAFEQATARVAELHPDPAMGGLDWAAEVALRRPAAEAAESAAELRPILRELLRLLGDSHYQVLPGDGGEAGFGPADCGVVLRFLPDGRVVVVRTDGVGEVQPGWILLSIDGVPVRQLIEAEEARLSPPLPQLDRLRAVERALSGTAGSVVQLELLDLEDATRRVEQTRRSRESGVRNELLGAEVHISWALSEDEAPIGRFTFDLFLPPVPTEFGSAMSALVAAEGGGLILDLRGNPGGLGLMASGLAAWLVDERVSLGEMRQRESTLRFPVFPRPASQRFDGPVAILVDEASASTSEIFAHGLQQLGRARVFGRPSAGMALPSVIETLPNGDRLQVVVADLAGPDGVRLEGTGVQPDQPVPLSRQGLADGDPTLDAAYAWLRQLRENP